VAGYCDPRGLLGIGYGYLELCVLAEELGRAVAPAPTRSHARLTFDGALAQPIGSGESHWSLIEKLRDRAAVLFAFEQLGGADAALEMATEYAKNRYAFGRPIGSFQAIKHKLADGLPIAATSSWPGPTRNSITSDVS
jgi:alkylation response protein AidB-like acyl-CoA dehydrogenase